MAEKITLHGHVVHGIELDDHSRCAHYKSPLDVVAIKFKCCRDYYGCYFCHLMISKHPCKRWQRDERHKRAFLCGVCGLEMSIWDYLQCGHRCLQCKSAFNPGCRAHHDLYFE